VAFTSPEPQAAIAAFISAAAGVHADAGAAEAAGVRGITLTFFSCAFAGVIAAKAAKAAKAAVITRGWIENMMAAPP
jgi:hypothetical protein